MRKLSPDTGVLSVVFYLGCLLFSHNSGAEVRKLGEVTISCDARDLTIRGNPHTRVPPGKYEWVKVHVPRDRVDYDCGTRRRTVFCRLDTDFVLVRRSAVPGSWRMQCWGDPPLLLPVAPGGEEGSEGDSSGADPGS